MDRHHNSTRDGDDPTQGATGVIVVGGGKRGLGIATALSGDRHSVAFVDDGTEEQGSTPVQTLSRAVDDAASLRAVAEAVGEVDVVVAAGTDSQALLVAHLTRLELPDATPVAVVDDPWHRGAFDGVDARLVELPGVLAGEICTHVAQPGRS